MNDTEYAQARVWYDDEDPADAGWAFSYQRDGVEYDGPVDECQGPYDAEDCLDAAAWLWDYLGGDAALVEALNRLGNVRLRYRGPSDWRWV